MRVGLIVYGSLDTVSGGYRYDRELVRRLEARGAQVELFSQRWRPYGARLLGNIDRDLLLRLRRAPLDLLLQDELNHPSLFLFNRRLRSPVPVVSIVHHLRVSERHPPGLRRVYRVIERLYLDTVDAFLFNSRTTAESVWSLSPRRRPALVAEPAGQPPETPLIAAEIEQRAQRRPLRLLFVGNVAPRKGLHVLLQALALVPPGGWHLDVVGDLLGELGYVARCRALAAALPDGAVSFHGRVPDSELHAIYRESHLFCVPSQYEGYGIVYAEALHYGLPVIATTAGAAGELVTDGVNGFLVSPDDAEAIARHVGTLLQDRDRLAALSRGALQQAARLPTWDSSMNRAVDFLERLAAARAEGVTHGIR